MMLPGARGDGGFQSGATMDGSVSNAGTPTHSVSKGVTFYQLILHFILSVAAMQTGLGRITRFRSAH